MEIHSIILMIVVLTVKHLIGKFNFYNGFQHMLTKEEFEKQYLGGTMRYVLYNFRTDKLVSLEVFSDYDTAANAAKSWDYVQVLELIGGTWSLT